MCTINIEVSEAMMQKINPALNTKESIGNWLQRLVDQIIDDMSTLHGTSPNAYTAEEMNAILANRICRAEAGDEKLVSNDVVLNSISAKYGFSKR